MQAMASCGRAIASLLFLIALMSLLITTVVSIPVATRSILPSGDYLRPGDSIIRSGFKLTMREDDCNLVLSDPSSNQIWKSDNNKGGKACRAGLEYDGLFVIRNRENENVWDSENTREGKYPRQVIINDRNGAVEIRDAYHDLIWSSNDVLKP